MEPLPEPTAPLRRIQQSSAPRKDEPLSRLGYAASDFVMMPSSFEPCGLAQMIGLRYGSLPIAHRTGGLNDTVSRLDPQADSGNGFLFDVHDAAGLRWAIERALDFHRMEPDDRERNRIRIMAGAEHDFSPRRMIRDYLGIYRSLAPVGIWRLHADSKQDTADQGRRVT